MIIVLLRVEIPFDRRDGSNGRRICSSFCFGGRAIERRDIVHVSASAACTGPPYCVLAHHIAQREENTAQQHHAQKKPNQMPAFQHPVTASAFSISSH